MTVRLLPCGRSAWLLELDDDPNAVLGVAEAAAAGADVAEVVPGARTVLAHLVAGTDRDAAGAALLERANAPRTRAHVAGTTDPIELEVRYDGDDLEAVAEACGMTVADVVDRHTAATYRSAFCGFAPGFAYLTGLDPTLHLPRRSTPRTRVPAGSVAVAAAYSAVYPTASPGGWHLLGRTTARLFDPEREPPALLAPGTTVRFVAAR